MMDPTLYEMIFKRKSFHLFRQKTGEVSLAERSQILAQWETFEPLDKNIKTALRIVDPAQTSCGRQPDYCLLLYSEKKPHYLENIGYLGEQLDLYLARLHIGALWFGIGKPEMESIDDLHFVIMIAIAKMPPEQFRKDMFKAKRKPLAEIWSGPLLSGVSEIVRFAPSACNTQPWLVVHKPDELWVYRYKKPGKRGIMPKDKVSYYNQIDIGIFLLFLSLCLQHEQVLYQRELFEDDGDEKREQTLVAIVKFKQNNECSN